MVSVLEEDPFRKSSEIDGTGYILKDELVFVVCTSPRCCVNKHQDLKQLCVLKQQRMGDTESWNDRGRQGQTVKLVALIVHGRVHFILNPWGVTEAPSWESAVLSSPWVRATTTLPNFPTTVPALVSI